GAAGSVFTLAENGPSPPLALGTGKSRLATGFFFKTQRLWELVSAKRRPPIAAMHSEFRWWSATQPAISRRRRRKILVANVARCSRRQAADPDDLHTGNNGPSGPPRETNAIHTPKRKLVQFPCDHHPGLYNRACHRKDSTSLCTRAS